jgi:peptidoglycan/LPS O-acetylase OafA/YrhL
MKDRRAALPALTGLRVVAALGVVFSHFGTPLAGNTWSRALQADAGWIGVDFFFLLSGFILAYTYLPDGRFRGTFRAFYVNRVARLYPAYLVGFLLAYGAVRVCGSFNSPIAADLWAAHPGGILLSTLTMTQGWVPYWGEVFNAPAVTLSIEACFYALFPLFALALVRLDRRSLLLALPMFWLAEMALPVLLAWRNVPLDDNARFALHFLPAGRLPEFLCGAILGRLFLLAREQGRPPIAAVWGMPLALAALAVLVLPLARVANWPLWNGALDPICAVLIWYAAWGRGWTAALFSTRGAVLLGEASYALYILHYPLHQWLVWLAPAGQESASYFLAYVALCLIASVALLRYGETPARAWLRAALLTPPIQAHRGADGEVPGRRGQRDGGNGRRALPDRRGRLLLEVGTGRPVFEPTLDRHALVEGGPGVVGDADLPVGGRIGGGAGRRHVVVVDTGLPKRQRGGGAGAE